MNLIDYLSIAPVASLLIQFVSSFSITTASDGNPDRLVLNIAIDPHKASGYIEFPVFLSARGKYPNSDTAYLKKMFLAGEPFVAVSIHGLRVYHCEETNSYGYVGFGDYFEIVPNPTDFMEEEELL